MLAGASFAADLRPIPGERSYTLELDAAIRQAEGGTLTIHPGRYTIAPVEIDEQVRIVGHGATLVISWTGPKRQGLTLSASVTIEGLTIEAGGSYSAVNVVSPGCVLRDVTVLDYSYKGVRVAFDDDRGTFLAERCYASSDRGNGSNVFKLGGVYPIAYQADAGRGKMMGSVVFRDCAAGPHPNSTSGGQSIKIATARRALLEGFRCEGEIDPANSHTLIVAEGVGRLTVRDSNLPRGITHYPPADAEQPDVELFVVENCDLGGEHSPSNLHDNLRARRLVYRDVRASIGRLGIVDETPDGIRRFDGCVFTGGEQVYWPKGVTPTITATDTHADAEWSSVREVQAKFEGATR